MSDALLRLARIVRDHLTDTSPTFGVVQEAAQLVRDLEAAPYASAPESCYQDGVLRCKQPRTITREELGAAARAWYAADVGRSGMREWSEVEPVEREYYEACAIIHARVFGFTVEDA